MLTWVAFRVGCSTEHQVRRIKDVAHWSGTDVGLRRPRRQPTDRPEQPPVLEILFLQKRGHGLGVFGEVGLHSGGVQRRHVGFGGWQFGKNLGLWQGVREGPNANSDPAPIGQLTVESKNLWFGSGWQRRPCGLLVGFHLITS